MDLKQTGVSATDRASALEVDRLLGVASREDLAECLRLLAVALAITRDGRPSEAAPTQATSPEELNVLIEEHYPHAMLTLAAFLRGVLEDGGTMPLH
jgi:hypothetical protein